MFPLDIKEALKESLQGDLTIAKLHYPKVLNDSALGIKATVNYESRLDHFISSLNKYKSTMTLTEDLYDKYKFNPKMMSYDLYGTVDYWWLLLQANEMHSAVEFNKRTIKYFSASAIKQLIPMILRSDYFVYNLYAEEARTDQRYATSSINVNMS